MNIETPKDGDTRYITKFLWTPQRFNGALVWMENVTIRQGYFYHGMFNPGWVDICLSDPYTGMPAMFDKSEDTPLLKNPMTKIGIYPNITKDSYIKK
jgi:hypothetical protein